MRQYLGSPSLREQVARFWALGRPVGAICHGVLVLARTRDPATSRSVLSGCRTTCPPGTWNAPLTWMITLVPVHVDHHPVKRADTRHGPVTNPPGSSSRL